MIPYGAQEGPNSGSKVLDFINTTKNMMFSATDRAPPFIGTGEILFDSRIMAYV